MALFGLIAIVYGFRITDTIGLWDPLPYSREFAFVLMPIAVIFLMPGSGSTNFFQKFKHPMFVGILIWAFTHLLTNGDLRSTLFFFALSPYIV